MSESGWQTYAYPHDRSFLIKHKLVETKTPHLKKLIVLLVKKRSALSYKGLFLVRDGYIVKPLTKKSKSIMWWVIQIGYQRPIRAVNIGALFKKYNIPKSTGKILLEHRKDDLHAMCRKFSEILSIFDGSVDNTNKVLKKFELGLLTRTVYNNLFATMSKLSTQRKIDVLTHEHTFDIIRIAGYLNTVAPDVFNEFNWKQSAQNIHDNLSKAAERIRNPNLYTPINYINSTTESIEWANSFLEKDNLSLKLAENHKELIDWGNHLDHCIGSYGKEALEGAAKESSILLGVYEKGKENPSWTILMRAQGKLGYWGISQFYGRFNSHPPEDIKSKVGEALILSRSPSGRKKHEQENEVLVGS